VVQISAEVLDWNCVNIFVLEIFGMGVPSITSDITTN
jgi:hypothetical protein